MESFASPIALDILPVICISASQPDEQYPEHEDILLISHCYIYWYIVDAQKPL